jgi:hypothetical protein
MTPRPHRLGGVAALAIAACAGGCSFDLTEVTREPTVTFFQLQVDLPTCAGPLHLEAQFHPGTDEGGAVRPVVVDTLSISGRTIPPVMVHELGTREYRIHDGDPDALAPANVMRVRVPATGAQRPAIDVHMLRSVATDSIIASRAATTMIDVLGTGGDDRGVSVPGIPAYLAGVHWWASVMPDSSTRPVLSFEVGALAGSAIALPAAVLPASFTRGRVRLRGLASHHFSPAADFRMAILRSFECEIPLRIVD